jgi:hypothetical protein
MTGKLRRNSQTTLQIIYYTPVISPLSFVTAPAYNFPIHCIPNASLWAVGWLSRHQGDKGCPLAPLPWWGDCPTKRCSWRQMIGVRRCDEFICRCVRRGVQTFQKILTYLPSYHLSTYFHISTQSLQPFPISHIFTLTFSFFGSKKPSLPWYFILLTIILNNLKHSFNWSFVTPIYRYTSNG